MQNTNDVDLLRYLEIILIGSLLLIYRIVQTNRIFIFLPSKLVEYLQAEPQETKLINIKNHHVDIVRPLTFSVFSYIILICTFLLAIDSIVGAGHGISFEMPKLKQIQDLSGTLGTLGLSQIFLFLTPFIVGLALSGGISVKLLLGKTSTLKFKVALYLSSYFCGVFITLLNILLIIFLLVLQTDYYDFVFIVGPLLLLSAFILIYYRMINYFSCLSGLASWRCILSPACIISIMCLSIYSGVILSGIELTTN